MSGRDIIPPILPVHSSTDMFLEWESPEAEAGYKMLLRMRERTVEQCVLAYSPREWERLSKADQANRARSMAATIDRCCRGIDREIAGYLARFSHPAQLLPPQRSDFDELKDLADALSNEHALDSLAYLMAGVTFRAKAPAKPLQFESTPAAPDDYAAQAWKRGLRGPIVTELVPDWQLEAAVEAIDEDAALLAAAQRFNAAVALSRAATGKAWCECYKQEAHSDQCDNCDNQFGNDTAPGAEAIVFWWQKGVDLRRHVVGAGEELWSASGRGISTKPLPWAELAAILEVHK